MMDDQKQSNATYCWLEFKMFKTWFGGVDTILKELDLNETNCTVKQSGL